MPSSFFSPTFNPARLMLGQNPNKPYVSTQGNATKTVSVPQNATLGAQAVRATGQGPYDAAYRQNLATYAGGNLARPGGFLGFNPTGSIFGSPTGGGNAPVPGAPLDLLTQAYGGQGYSTPRTSMSASQPKTNAPAFRPGNYQDWIKQYQMNGSHLRLY